MKNTLFLDVFQLSCYSKIWRMTILLIERDKNNNEIGKSIIAAHCATDDNDKLEEFIRRVAVENNVKTIEYTEDKIYQYFSEELKNAYNFIKYKPF